MLPSNLQSGQGLARRFVSIPHSGNWTVLLKLEDPAPTRIIHMAAKFVLAEPSLRPLHVGLSTGLLRHPHSALAGFQE